jgi:hypothetical protein
MQISDSRWHITQDGNIAWTVNGQTSHFDHVEMSGKRISVVLRYGVEKDGSFMLNRSIVWPMLRTIPNDTHASLMRRQGWDITKSITVNGYSLDSERVKEVRLGGTLWVQSEFNLPRNSKVELVREMCPSTTLPAFCESYVIKNISDKDLTVEIPNGELAVSTDSLKGVEGSYTIISKVIGGSTKVLKPNEEVRFGAYFIGYKHGEPRKEVNIDEEISKRKTLVSNLQQDLVLETPDSVLNTMFSFAKVRASESIYETKCGPLHGPGGESYYAAIWANDQAEYVSPFFPYLGYSYGNESALNAYRQFARFMNKQYKPIPSSIIAEGTDIWNGAGDRGDAAMVAYGASRYALARGDMKEASELWPLIEWCLEYCKRNLNKEGVVASDADELEGRFPAGKANLCTSSLYYDALISASYLGKEMGKSSFQIAAYKKQAEELKKAINNYFKGPVEGFDTYRYYKENDVLRSWICIPLTVGIYDRKVATINALFSPRLWTSNGLLTQAGSETFWDRSTLYALRGVYACGETEKANDYMTFYSKQRLLGEHVPYAIEAYPEGGQRHLSAESGLYCRIITEGMFGIRPTGLSSFTLTPRLPKAWDQMKLKRVNAFGHCFDIEVYRKGEELEVKIAEGGIERYRKIIKDGQSIDIVLKSSIQ